MTDILNAFYHRGRKTFLPMTSADLGRKMGVTSVNAAIQAKRASLSGHVEIYGGSGDSRNNPVIYELTQSGRNVVMARMMEGVI